jgi:PAS domain S-box-containing protein
MIEALSQEIIKAIFNTLPVDITFVDRDDQVLYFNQSKDRVFARSKVIIGRKVQKCHSEKSVHIVERILKAFKEGTKDVAEFWSDLNGRLIYIRYFPVRSQEGEYLGCVEVTQDITDIQEIKGERRLLEWEE